MECTFDIKVAEPQKNDMLFKPHINFRIKQLNMTPNCMTEMEIDEQIDFLIRDVAKLRKKAKKKLKEAKLRHDKLLMEK